MSKREDLLSMFQPTSSVIVRVVLSHDVVHRKNLKFASQALQQSGFAKLIVSLVNNLPNSCALELLGEDNKDVDSIDLFCKYFLRTNCRHHVNYHDEKMCTVEFSCKFKSTIQDLLALPIDILDQLHLEVITPVGNVQL